MADGDVLVDTAMMLPNGERVRLFAVESSEYPGGVTIGDNTRIPTHGAGYHHRHAWVDGEESVIAIEFVDLETHLTRFETEIRANDRE